MTAGNLILPNHAIYSLTKNHALVMQSDGNLVVYDISWEAIWAAGINGKGGVRAIMQGDGNFVVYKSYTSMSPSEAVWSTGTYNNPGAWITMQDDGNLVVYNAAGTRALWASNSVWNQVGQ
jgi:exopolysaccharide biosynthesis protein